MTTATLPPQASCNQDAMALVVKFQRLQVMLRFWTKPKESLEHTSFQSSCSLTLWFWHFRFRPSRSASKFFGELGAGRNVEDFRVRP